MNQQHLIAEKKAKYAVIERDALIRLSQPRASSASPSKTTRHIRGASGSSSRRKSNASVAGSTKENNAKDRLSIAISDSSSGSGPLSPTLLTGRRPSRSAEPPAMVLERTEEMSVTDRSKSPGATIMKSRPPSPVKEESSSQGHGEEEEGESGHQPTFEVSAPNTPAQPSTERFDGTPSASETVQTQSQTYGQSSDKVSPSSTTSPPDAMAIKSSATPKKRRTSLAPSERSVKTISARSGTGMGPAHPGVIRLYSTFNDKMSLCKSAA